MTLAVKIALNPNTTNRSHNRESSGERLQGHRGPPVLERSESATKAQLLRKCRIGNEKSVAQQERASIVTSAARSPLQKA